MGTQVRTLADRIPTRPFAVVVGLNPSPDSVKVGHYYEGKAGRNTVWPRLHTCGLAVPGTGWDDDAAYDAGVGFTDLVKRPSYDAGDVRSDEIRHGRPLLRRKLYEANPRLVVFTYPIAGRKFLGKQLPAGADAYGVRTVDIMGRSISVFVMPGPYEQRDRREDLLGQLRTWLFDAGWRFA